MATKTVYLSGTCKWAKLAKPDEKYNRYAINLYMDTKSEDVFKKSGMQNEVKKDKDGLAFISLGRPLEKLMKGEVVKFGPPVVLNVSNDPYPEDDLPLIGNGSEVTCKVSVYDTMKGKGHRLEAVRIDNLVVYEGSEDYPDAPF